MNKITKILLVCFGVGAMVFQARIAFAAPAGFTDWNKRSFSSEATTANNRDTICSNLFRADPENIFRETICSLVSVTSLSVGDFAANTTCTIQQLGNGTNYSNSANGINGRPITFSAENGQCRASGGFGTDDNIFGEPAGAASTGFYSNQESQLSNDLNPTRNSPYITGYKFTRGITTLIAVVFLFVFAFANILHIDINTYAIKKALPAVVIAIAGSWLIIYVIYFLSRFIDFLYRLSIFSPYQSLHPMFNIFGGNFSGQITNIATAPTSGASPDISSLNLVFTVGQKLLGGTTYSFTSGLLGTIFLIVPAVAVFAFEYVLAMRAFAVGLLTIVAPIAFACFILPQTQFIFRKWWSFLFIAIFYAPIANFIFYILNQFQPNSSPVIFVALWAFKLAAIILLIRFPFTIESDLKKITYTLSKTDLGAALGLERLKLGLKEQPKETKKEAAAPISALESAAAKNIIAPTIQTPSQAVRSQIRAISAKTEPLIAKPSTVNLASIADNAARANLTRSKELLIRSSADLSPVAFRKILSHSDPRLWRDAALVQELKNKNGQILDEEGAAIRSDAARKLVRLAEVVENNKIANPDAVRLLAQKGLLDVLPLNILKKSLDSGVINKSDLISTFKERTDEVMKRINNPKLAQAPFLNSSQIKELMIQDQKDYMSGFKDLSRMFSDVVRDPNIVPPPPPAVVRNIIDEMQSTDKNIFEKNGMYYLERLGSLSKQSQNTIATVLKNAGVPSQTAISIARNPGLNLEDAKNYVPGGKLSPESFAMLRVGFLNRDLANEMGTHISKLISENKTLISKGITQKIAENIKEGAVSGIDDVKNQMQQAIKDLSGPLSPEQIKKISGTIDKFYPGTTLKTAGSLGPEDIQMMQERARNVIETTDNISASGISKDELISQSPKVFEKIENQVNESIYKVLSGEAKAKTEEIVKSITNENHAKPQGKITKTTAEQDT